MAGLTESQTSMAGLEDDAKHHPNKPTHNESKISTDNLGSNLEASNKLGAYIEKNRNKSNNDNEEEKQVVNDFPSDEEERELHFNETEVEEKK